MVRHRQPVSFAGPAVDGPMKGRLIVNPSLLFRVVRYPEIGSLTWPPPERTEPIDITTGYYEYDERSRYWKWKGWSDDT